jgi:hypothetical protein
MTQPFFSNHRPAGIPLAYDLGEHTLTIQDESVILADKIGADTTMQEICLDSEELYKLLVTLQTLFQ